jgi:hypothetical protein
MSLCHYRVATVLRIQRLHKKGSRLDDGASLCGHYDTASPVPPPLGSSHACNDNAHTSRVRQRAVVTEGKRIQCIANCLLSQAAASAPPADGEGGTPETPGAEGLYLNILMGCPGWRQKGQELRRGSALEQASHSRCPQRSMAMSTCCARQMRHCHDARRPSASSSCARIACRAPALGFRFCVLLLARDTVELHALAVRRPKAEGKQQAPQPCAIHPDCKAVPGHLLGAAWVTGQE